MGASNREVKADVVRLKKYTVATVPDATKYEGCLIYTTNGGGGSPMAAFSNGTNWLRVDTGAAIS